MKLLILLVNAITFNGYLCARKLLLVLTVLQQADDALLQYAKHHYCVLV